MISGETLKHILSLRSMDSREPCKWKIESNEFLQPECKQSAFLKYDDTIRAGFRFCPYCGHRIEVSNDEN